MICVMPQLLLLGDINDCLCSAGLDCTGEMKGELRVLLAKLDRGHSAYQHPSLQAARPVIAQALDALCARNKPAAVLGLHRLARDILTQLQHPAAND